MIKYALAALLPSVMCGVLAYLLFQEKNKSEALKSELNAKESELSTDATELLSQLVKGGAVVVTQVIDPAQVFMYSPKDKR